MKATATGLVCASLFLAAAILAAGCAETAVSTGGGGAATSQQTVEYFPYMVKGYQDSYPHRTIAVLLPVIAVPIGPNSAPVNGQPSIGVVTDASESVIQRLYTDPLPPNLQNAMVKSAGEAGLRPIPRNESIYSSDSKDADYVLACKITKCWVKKHRGLDNRYAATWSTVADFALEVTIYKPPFKVPFWQGTSNKTFYDPPMGSYGLGPDDEAGIYDDPGQVLSVAMTQAIAGIFEHQELHELVQEDHMASR